MIIIRKTVINVIVGAIVMEATLGILNGFKFRERIAAYIQAQAEPQDS